MLRELGVGRRLIRAVCCLFGFGGVGVGGVVDVTQWILGICFRFGMGAEGLLPEIQWEYSICITGV